jgi:hypothetical protein
MIVFKRAAIYASRASADALAACARYAVRLGLRVVTIVDDNGSKQASFTEQTLDRLMGRLAAGEFEAIVAYAGEGCCVVCQARIGEGTRLGFDPIWRAYPADRGLEGVS